MEWSGWCSLQFYGVITCLNFLSFLPNTQSSIISPFSASPQNRGWSNLIYIQHPWDLPSSEHGRVWVLGCHCWWMQYREKLTKALSLLLVSKLLLWYWSIAYQPAIFWRLNTPRTTEIQRQSHHSSFLCEGTVIVCRYRCPVSSWVQNKDQVQSNRKGTYWVGEVNGPIA